jgi:hypothetical protein
MTPRHPPRALRSLTTPTGRPPRDRSRERPPLRRQVTSPAVPRDRRLSTEVPPIQRVTIPCAGRSDVTSGPPAFQSKGSTFVEILGITCHVTLSLALVDLLLRDQTTGLSESPRRPPQRVPPGAAGPKAAGSRTGHPNGRRRAGRRPGGAVVPLGRRPRPAPGGARRGQEQERVNRPTPTPPQGGRRVGRVAIETDRSWSSRASEPTRGAGAGHARPPHGGVGADAASRCRARVAGEGGAGGFRRLRAGFSK